jgi:hypothetical protein
MKIKCLENLEARQILKAGLIGVLIATLSAGAVLSKYTLNNSNYLNLKTDIETRKYFYK